MLNEIIKDMLSDEHRYKRYERFDSINDILVISTLEHELVVTPTKINIYEVLFHDNVLDPFYGIPYHRDCVVSIDYEEFLSQDDEKVLNITKDDVNLVLSYYGKLHE